jgi:cell division protein FtsQ
MWRGNTVYYPQRKNKDWRIRSFHSDDDETASVGGDVIFRAGVITLIVLLLTAFILGALDWALRSDNFPVRQVRLEGGFSHVSKAQLERVVQDGLRGNFLTVDLDTVKQTVEAIPWVYRASVRRNWPRDITIRFSEQELVARWGASAWLNRAGQAVVLPAGDASAALPLLQGPQGTQAQVLEHYARFSRILVPLGRQISALQLSARGTWRVTLDDGLTLVLNRDQAQAKLQRFVRAYPQVLDRVASGIARIDLRYTNGFSVQWKQAHIAGVATQMAEHSCC